MPIVKGNGFQRSSEDCGNKMNKPELLGNVYGEQFGTGYAGNVWDINGICPTITCVGGGGGRMPSVLIDDERDKQREENR